MTGGPFLVEMLCKQLHFTKRTTPVFICKIIFTLFNCQGAETLWFPALLAGYLPITGLKSITEVKEFVRIVNDYPFDVDLSSGRYTVDAKSIMGIFSLDLALPITVEIQSDEAQSLIQQLTPFLMA